jgi:hypothetical protein
MNPYNGSQDEAHNCHFCGTVVKGGYEANGKRHWLSDCRPDLTEHEPGELCTWAPYRCYAQHEYGINHVYKDGPT